MTSQTKNTRYIAQAALIAAAYTVLTLLAAGFDLASGAIQVRFSEALTILPFFTPAAVPGLALGCLISNLITGCVLPDIIFGTLATLIGAVGTYALRSNRYLCALPPIHCGRRRVSVLHGPRPAVDQRAPQSPRKDLCRGLTPVILFFF